MSEPYVTIHGDKNMSKETIEAIVRAAQVAIEQYSKPKEEKK